MSQQQEKPPFGHRLNSKTGWNSNCRVLESQAPLHCWTQHYYLSANSCLFVYVPSHTVSKICVALLRKPDFSFHCYIIFCLIGDVLNSAFIFFGRPKQYYFIIETKMIAVVSHGVEKKKSNQSGARKAGIFSFCSY